MHFCEEPLYIPRNLITPPKKHLALVDDTGACEDPQQPIHPGILNISDTRN